MSLRSRSQRLPSTQSMVRSHQGAASKQSHSDENLSEWFNWVNEPPGLSRGIAPIKRSAVGLAPGPACSSDSTGVTSSRGTRPTPRRAVTGIGVVCLHEDPAFNRARCMPTLPRLALKETFGSDFVVAGLERPVHQKGHGRCLNQQTFSQARHQIEGRTRRDGTPQALPQS